MQNPSKQQIDTILKSAKTIAVVGLSDKPERTSYQVAKVMQEAGYRIIPVNPNASEILSEKTVGSLDEINEHVDIVNVFRRSEFLPEVARDFLKMDADVFWAQLGLVNEEAYELLKDSHPVIMDKCIKVAYREMEH
ncbi:CoA-binding protein [Listeria kieliensis]|uniref:CoA-binding protein n=1 Tax=Listeria kieliensis TaxID=1621700 RepID=A0A3D8TU66_9LIST|nr:CoA-binding protein [Listeria kieliensis]RDX02626.1 CoA-binding protein [Listeria kieliensis]